ncbi:MAG: hypothetical protein ABID04_02135 [Patescibacteria group bacterium]
MGIELKQILGTPNGESWSQIHQFKPGPDKIESKGELVFLVSLKNIGDEVESTEVGREIISRFNEEYYGKTGISPMQALEQALFQVGQEKSSYFQSPKQASLLVLLTWKQTVYLGTWHTGRILIRRNGQGKTLLTGQAQKAQVVSGPLQVGDLFLMASEDFFAQVPEGMLTASLATEDPEIISETLTPVVHAREKQGAIAAAVVKITNQLDQTSPSTDSAETEQVPFGKQVSPNSKQTPRLTKRPSLQLGQIIKRTILLTRKTSRLVKKTIPLKRLIPDGNGKRLGIALIFLGLFLTSVFLGWRKKSQQRQDQQVQEISSQIDQRLEAAETIKRVDPDNGLVLGKEAESLLEQLRAVAPGESRINGYQTRIASLLSGLGDKAITPDLYYDLNLISNDVQVKNSVSDGREFIVLDQKGRLLKVNLITKSGQILAGGEDLAKQELIALSGETIYLINNTDIGRLDKQELTPLIEIENENPTLAAGWLGSIYIFDNDNQQIWKHSATENGQLGPKQEWLKQELDFPADQVTDWDIDGRIWLLLANGRIHPFLKGQLDNFKQELPDGVGQAKFLTIAQTQGSLAFWDQDKKIVWIFDDQGQLVLRLLVNLETISNLALAPDGDRLFLLSGDKIYLLEI